MNELVTKENEALVSTKELAKVLNVSENTVLEASKKVLDFSQVLSKSSRGRPSYMFNELQCTMIKNEIKKHHNLKSRDIDNVTTNLELQTFANKLNELVADNKELHKQLNEERQHNLYLLEDINEVKDKLNGEVTLHVKSVEVRMDRNIYHFFNKVYPNRLNEFINECMRKAVLDKKFFNSVMD